MKSLLNIILVCAAGLLAYMCYESIQIPIQFNKEVAKLSKEEYDIAVKGYEGLKGGN